MSAAVLPIVSESQVDRAWDAYAVLARQLLAKPELIADRPFQERITRAHREWIRLFVVQEHGR